MNFSAILILFLGFQCGILSRIGLHLRHPWSILQRLCQVGRLDVLTPGKVGDGTGDQGFGDAFLVLGDGYLVSRCRV